MVRWQDRRRSDNVEFRKGAAGAGMTGMAFLLIRFIFSRFGLGGVVVLVGAFFVARTLGIDPIAMLSGGGGQVTREVSSESEDFVRSVVGTTEDVWSKLFAESGQRYPAPTVVVFQDQVQSGCGFASAQSGPFYCPADQKVYFDLSFFDELARRFGAPGDFAAAYVIAHEIGHHIQTITGISNEVRAAQQRASTSEANALQVRMELQADCYAGLWAHHADRAKPYLEEGDVEEALRAAAAIGDDTLQRNAGRRVTPESFTHGSSEQRARWFRTGLQTGRIDACDTFSANRL